MPAVGVLFQSGVDPVHKGKSLLLWSTHMRTHTAISKPSHTTWLKLDFWVDSDGLSVAEAQTAANVLFHMFFNFLVHDCLLFFCLFNYMWRLRRAIKSFYHTRERVLRAFTWKLWRPSDGQDAFFSVEDCPECLGYFTALQLLDYLEGTIADVQISNLCLKSYEKLTVLAKKETFRTIYFKLPFRNLITFFAPLNIFE